jgi:CheY-like chemotaxis protein
MSDAADQPLRVLVADDNRDGAETLSMLLELLGHRVRMAHDGQQAICEAGAFMPHIVFMDLGMPGMDGLEATRRIRAEPWGNEMRIVALTGWGQDQARERSRAAGCDGHLVKPVEPADLATLIGTLIAQPSRLSDALAEPGNR